MTKCTSTFGRPRTAAAQDFVSDESLLNKDELQIILGDKYVEPTTANPRVTHDAKAANVLSGLMPGALF